MLDLTATISFWENKISLQFGAKNLFDISKIQQSQQIVQGAHVSAATNLPIGWGRTYFTSIKFQIK
jgi:hypothetical protein